MFNINFNIIPLLDYIREWIWPVKKHEMYKNLWVLMLNAGSPYAHAFGVFITKIDERDIDVGAQKNIMASLVEEVRTGLLLQQDYSKCKMAFEAFNNFYVLNAPYLSPETRTLVNRILSCLRSLILFFERDIWKSGYCMFTAKQWVDFVDQIREILKELDLSRELLQNEVVKF
jgi:hypothetical protein